MRIVFEVRDPVWEYVWEMELKTKPVSINKKYILSKRGFNTILVLSEEYRRAKGCIWEEARLKWGSRRVIKDLPVGIIITMQKSRVDIDAYIKIILDALQGVVYANDRQVRKLSVEII